MAKLGLDLKVAARTVLRARFASALAVLAFALGFLASYRPARSAGRVDPMIVLRDA